MRSYAQPIIHHTTTQATRLNVSALLWANLLISDYAAHKTILLENICFENSTHTKIRGKYLAVSINNALPSSEAFLGGMLDIDGGILRKLGQSGLRAVRVERDGTTDHCRKDCWGVRL